MANTIRLATEFMDNGDIIGTYRFADAERALEMLAVYSTFTNVSDGGFLCVDDAGNDHCRCIFGDNSEGRRVMALLCDRC